MSEAFWRFIEKRREFDFLKEVEDVKRRKTLAGVRTAVERLDKRLADRILREYGENRPRQEELPVEHAEWVEKRKRIEELRKIFNILEHEISGASLLTRKRR
ncbi:MAG: hypothetical protein V1717_03755 [Candidatus Micrarchaeota archaeon]